VLCILHHFHTQTLKNSALCRKAARRCSANGTCACRLTVGRGVVAMLTHINNSGKQSRLDFTLCVGVCVALCQHPQPASTIGDTTTPTKRISMGVYRRWNCGSWRGMLAAIRHRRFLPDFLNTNAVLHLAQNPGDATASDDQIAQ